MNWWQAPEWGNSPAMTFPRRDNGKTVVLRDGREKPDKGRPWEQPRVRRIRIFA